MKLPFKTSKRKLPFKLISDSSIPTAYKTKSIQLDHSYSKDSELKGISLAGAKQLAIEIGKIWSMIIIFHSWSHFDL